jgi:hypothetical protein
MTTFNNLVHAMMLIAEYAKEADSLELPELYLKFKDKHDRYYFEAKIKHDFATSFMTYPLPHESGKPMEIAGIKVGFYE